MNVYDVPSFKLSLSYALLHLLPHDNPIKQDPLLPSFIIILILHRDELIYLQTPS